MVAGEADAKRLDTALEKRRHLRVEVALNVVISIAGRGTRPPDRAFTRDISHGGACLAVPGCSEELLEMLLGLPLIELVIDFAREASRPGNPSVPTRFQGRVEWVRRPARSEESALIGLEFQNLSATEEMAIIDLIAHVLIHTKPPCLQAPLVRASAPALCR